MVKIDGQKIAAEIIERLKATPRPDKILAAVLVDSASSPQVGAASVSFLKQKEKVAKELGIDFRIYKFDGSLKNDDLRKEVFKIALSKPVGGVIVQLPLPEHINKHYVLNAIPREKDVDVLGERALGAFYTGRSPVLPPAVGVVEEILLTTNYQLLNTKVAVVGLGFLVGKPIAVYLMDKCRELALFEQGSDLNELKNFDLVISGVGQAGIIKSSMLKEGAGIIDFGYSLDESGKISGDLDTSQLINRSTDKLKFYTPTPGGTGPILVAKLFENFYRLNNTSK